MPRGDTLTLDLDPPRAPLLPAPEMLCVVEAMRLWPKTLVKESGGVVRVASEVAEMLAARGCLRPVKHGQRGNFSGRFMLTRLPA